MASNSTVSITFKFDGDEKSFKELISTTEGLEKAMKGAVVQVNNLKDTRINFAALASGIQAAQKSLSTLESSFKGLADAYSVQEMAETRLATVMQQRMGATDEQINKIKELASAQQEIGVVGDEVQLSGAQQMATFLNQTESIETLIPAMNNLLVQQKGLTASTEDAKNIGNLLGKAMQGQTSALSRAGITFTEAQKKVMQFGTESERAAMLAEIITANVGEMNKAAAETDSGKQQQLANWLGDIKEKIGGWTNAALPFITITNGIAQASGSVATLIAGMKALKTATLANTKAFLSSTKTVIANQGAIMAKTVAEKAATAATAIWTGAQKMLYLVLSANPIGLVIIAIGALVSAAVYAYNNFESFRNIVDKVWNALKSFVELIWDSLVEALSALCNKLSEAWEWMKRLVGFSSGKKIEVEVSAKTSGGTDLTDLEKKYANYKPETGGGTKSVPTIMAKQAEVQIPQGSVKWVNDRISTLEAKLDVTLDPDARRKLLKEIAELQTRLKSLTRDQDYINKFGKDAEIRGTNPLDSIVKSAKDLQENPPEIKLPFTPDEVKNSISIADAFNAVASGMKNITSACGEGVAAWGEWMAAVITSLATAIPMIKEAACANAVLGATEAGPFGWLAAAGAVAATVATLMAIPKFADGGIISGPTLGLMGEYPGAANNPEVVAPLSDLRGMLDSGSSAIPETIRIYATGGDLQAIINTRTRKISRS